MKTKINTLIILSIIIGSITLNSCENTKTDYKKQIYTAADFLSQKIIDTYLHANYKINYKNSYQQELANILKGEKTNDNQTPSIQPIHKFNYKLNLFTAYRELMFELQNNKNPNNQTVREKINTVLNFSDSLNNQKNTAKSNEIRKYISAHRFDINIAIYETTNIIFQTYKKDVNQWTATLKEKYTQYSKTVNQIPEDIFDHEKLEKFIYEPYKNKTTLTNIYKLNMKQNFYEQNTKFINNAIAIKNTFNSLRKALQNTTNNQSELNNYLIEQIINEIKTYNSQKQTQKNTQ